MPLGVELQISALGPERSGDGLQMVPILAPPVCRPTQPPLSHREHEEDACRHRKTLMIEASHTFLAFLAFLFVIAFHQGLQHGDC